MAVGRAVVMTFSGRSVGSARSAGRGSLVNDDRPGPADAGHGLSGDPQPLLRGVHGARLLAGLEGVEVDGADRAVGAHDLPVLLQTAQVAADRLGRAPEVLGRIGHSQRTALVGQGHDAGPPGGGILLVSRPTGAVSLCEAGEAPVRRLLMAIVPVSPDGQWGSMSDDDAQVTRSVHAVDAHQLDVAGG